MYRRVLPYLTIVVALAGCQFGESTGPDAKQVPTSPALAIVTGSSQTATNASSGAASLTIPKPAGVVDGDLLVVQVSFEKGNEIDFTRPGTVPANWVLAQRNNFGSDIGQAIFYKKIPTAATEPASYTWSFRKNDNSSLQVRATGGITRYAGADLAHHQGPILTSSGASGDGRTLNAPGVIATENSVLIAFFSVKKQTTLSNPTVPAPMVSIYHRQHGNQSGPTIRSSNELRTTDGPTGQRTSTASAGEKWVAQLIVLRVPACEEPDPNCESEAVNLTTGGNVDNGTGGITIAPGSGSTTHTITVSVCPDLNDRVTDLPQFGSCIRVTADPPLPEGGLEEAARVYACDLNSNPDNPLAGRVFNEAQEELITMHKLDGSILRALPHADDDCAAPLPSISSAGARLKGLLTDIVRLRWKDAGSRVARLVTPKPLYATTLLDEGGGGLAFFFSDFQFLLPTSSEIVEGNNQTGTPGQPLDVDPTVFVTDLLGNPVIAGARITFSTDDGSVLPTSVVTDDEGLASTEWTIENLGANTMIASGRGIAGDDPNNGPRAGDENCWREGEEEECQDPWQPLDESFGDETDGPELIVGTGTRTFNATGVAGAISITDVEMSTATLFIGGDQATYTAELSNTTGAAVGSSEDPVKLQGWTDQVAPAASRAAGGANVQCGAGSGTLPPGTCFHNFTFGAANFGANGVLSAGSGTLIPGSATARFDLTHGDVEDVFTIPITIYQIRPVASSLTSSSGGNVLVPIVNPSGLSMQAGATIQLEVAPGATTAWTSSNAAAATVSATGLVTAVVGNTDPSTANEATISANIGTATGRMKVNSFAFGQFPRLTTLAWVPVAGAATYDVITEFGNGCTVGTAVCETWTGGVVATGVTTLAYHFEFVGAQPGRWRIVARDSEGAIISTSVNVYFRYTV